VRFLRGDFRKADPQRGRFATMSKRPLSNLINDYFRARKRDRDYSRPTRRTQLPRQISACHPIKSF